MSELIRREEAMKALAQLRDGAHQRYDSGLIAGSCLAMVGHELVAYKTAISTIRALPAIGTCKECANSKPYDASAVRCAWLKDAVNLRWGDALVCVFVDPDHYCAAFRRRPDNA